MAAAKTLASIADDCDNVLAFLQAVAVESPRVLAAPLSLCMDKRVRVWFQRCTDVNLTKPPTSAPQDYLGFTDVLTDVATRMHTAEVLRPAVAAQREMEKESKGRTASHLEPSASSWRRAPPPEPPFRPRRFPPFTASSTRGTQRPFKLIFL